MSARGHARRQGFGLTLLTLSGPLGLDIDAQSVLGECYPLLIRMAGFCPWQESRVEPSSMTRAP